VPAHCWRLDSLSSVASGLVVHVRHDQTWSDRLTASRT
jgi:hypothetical protein